MTFNISVVSEGVDEVADLFSEMGDKLIEQARVASTNAAMSEIRKGIKKDIREETGASAKAIGKRMRIFRLKFGKKSARLFVGTTPLAQTPDKKGRFRSGVTRSKRGKYSPNKPFTATLKSGAQGVFKRAGRERTPINWQYVPVYEAAKRSARWHVNTFIPKFYPPLFDRQLSRLITRAAIRRNLKPRR